jgi:hypothetical protein
LPHGKARAGTVARKLGVSRRTLARRLATEQLTLAISNNNLARVSAGASFDP